MTEAVIGKTCTERLEAFLDSARSRFNANLITRDWTDDKWLIDSREALSKQERCYVVFKEDCDPTALMAEPFLSFAKAVVWQFVSRKLLAYTASAYRSLMPGLRALYAQLPEGGKDPTLLLPEHFDDAEDRLRLTVRELRSTGIRERAGLPT